MRSLLYGEEMFVLAQTLTFLENAEYIEDIAILQLPHIPPEPHLRPTTWQAVHSFRRVIEDVQLVKNSLSRSTRSLALNRALGELTTLLDTTDTLPEAERGLIQDIAETWKESLLGITGGIGTVEITQPVRNPYVIGYPVSRWA
ncbi:MAG: hypothetical protein SW833_19820 [Cyanobacteriota bacterium]|nr:hypothetical protein [Cyanobacteriota bacterium]